MSDPATEARIRGQVESFVADAKRTAVKRCAIFIALIALGLTFVKAAYGVPEHRGWEAELTATVTYWIGLISVLLGLLCLLASAVNLKYVEASWNFENSIRNKQYDETARIYAREVDILGMFRKN